MNIILLEAVTCGQSAQAGDELHVTGFIRNADRKTPLATIAKGVKVSEELKKMRVADVKPNSLS